MQGAPRRETVLWLVVVLWGLAVLCGCGPSYDTFSTDTSEDRVFYTADRIRGNLMPDDPVVLVFDGTRVGTVVPGPDKRSLRLLRPSGGSVKIWRYHDDSGVSKIALARDGVTLRLYYWASDLGTLFQRRDYVIEVDLETGEARTYQMPDQAK